MNRYKIVRRALYERFGTATVEASSIEEAWDKAFNMNNHSEFDWGDDSFELVDSDVEDVEEEEVDV